jgi:hypothetical protein
MIHVELAKQDFSNHGISYPVQVERPHMANRTLEQFVLISIAILAYKAMDEKNNLYNKMSWGGYERLETSRELTEYALSSGLYNTAEKLRTVIMFKQWKAYGASRVQMDKLLAVTHEFVKRWSKINDTKTINTR